MPALLSSLIDRVGDHAGVPDKPVRLGGTGYQVWVAALAQVPDSRDRRGVSTGKITADACHPRHRNGEFEAFLKQVAKAHPRVKLHLVVDNYGTHSHPNVKARLTKNPRITMHFTPTAASWMNMVEIELRAHQRGRAVWVVDCLVRTYIDSRKNACD